MYNFIANCWKMGKISQNQLEVFVTKGFLTEEEKNEVLNIPQNGRE